MEEEQLLNEIKKLRKAYVEQKAMYDTCTTDSKEVMDENKRLNDNNRLTQEKITTLEKQLKKCKENNEDLGTSRHTLCENIKILNQEATAQNNLKMEIIELEKQIIQLARELVNCKELNVQYFQENSLLTESLVDANNKVEETDKKLNRLKTQAQEITSGVTNLREKIIQLTEELRRNQQTGDSMLETLQKIMELTAKNSGLKSELTRVVQLNKNLDNQCAENKIKIDGLKDACASSQAKVEEFASLNAEQEVKRSELITELGEVENHLQEKMCARDDLLQKKRSLENDLRKAVKDLNNLDASYKIAEEQLRIALEQKVSVENELKTVTNTEENGGELEDLQFALITCMVIIRKAFREIMDAPDGSVVVIDTAHADLNE